MKAKYFKKIRKFELFKVYETESLFGGEYKYFKGEFIAKSHFHAVKRFLRKYKRRNREDYEDDINTETTRKWGKLKVINTKGFKKYFF